jgi:hypothetical protein
MKKYISDILFGVGGVLIAVGVFLIYIPAGFITLGVCFSAFAFIYAKGGG